MSVESHSTRDLWQQMLDINRSNLSIPNSQNWFIQEPMKVKVPQDYWDIFLSLYCITLITLWIKIGIVRLSEQLLLYRRVSKRRAGPLPPPPLSHFFSIMHSYIRGASSSTYSYTQLHTLYSNNNKRSNETNIRRITKDLAINSGRYKSFRYTLGMSEEWRYNVNTKYKI